VQDIVIPYGMENKLFYFYLFYYLLPPESNIFHVKINFLMKFDQNPDPDQETGTVDQ
jgi:hypothetical protein